MKFINKSVTLNSKKYTLIVTGGSMFFSVYISTTGANRQLHTPKIQAEIMAAIVAQDHAEALEINDAIDGITPAMKKAAEIMADVKRRMALYSLAGQEVKFSVIDRPDRFGVHFQTVGGEDISGYAYFRDHEEMYAVIDELNRLLKVKPAHHGKMRVVFERQPETACAIRQHNGAFFRPVWRLNTDVMDIERIPEGSKPVLRMAAEIKNGVALIPVCKLGAGIDIEIPDDLYVVYEEAN